MLRAGAIGGNAAPAPSAGTGRWEAWDRFLESRDDAGFMQSSWWADFRLDAGYGHFGAILKDRGEIVGGALVLTFSREGTRFYYVPEGPVLPEDEAGAEQVFGALLDVIDARRRAEAEPVSHVRLEPRWEVLPRFLRDFRPVPAFSDPYMEPRDTLCVDLRLSEEALLAQMKPKGRYNIAVARRHGVEVVEDGSDRGLADFLDLYGETMDRQGLGAKPDDYFRKLLSLLGPSRRGSLFFAEYRGLRLAAALVVHFGRRTTYFFGGSRACHREVMCPYLLHWEIMRRARESGREWYDFWGVAPPEAEGHPWRDISAFKRKFGGREVRLVPTLDSVLDPAAYRDYRERARG